MMDRKKPRTIREKYTNPDPAKSGENKMVEAQLADLASKLGASSLYDEAQDRNLARILKEATGK